MGTLKAGCTVRSLVPKYCPYYLATVLDVIPVHYSCLVSGQKTEVILDVFHSGNLQCHLCNDPVVQRPDLPWYYFAFGSYEDRLCYNWSPT